MLTSTAYFRPIIPILVSLISGILFGYQLPGFDILVYVFAVTSIVLILINLLEEYKQVNKIRLYFTNIAIPLILFSSLGYVSIQPWIHPQFPKNHIIHYKDSDKYEITGTVCSIPKKFNRRQRFVINVYRMKNNKEVILATGKMRVTVYGQGPDLFKGDDVWFISRIKSIRNFKNPGGFDYQRYMAFKKIWTTAYTQADRIRIVKTKQLTFGFDYIEEYRKKVSIFIQKNAEENASGLLKALLLGDKTGISKDTREAFNRAGVAHVLAISGLHIGIIAMFFFAIFQTMLLRVDVFLWNGWVKKTAGILTLLPVMLYGLLSGMSPSTQRALIMVGLFLITFLFDREQDSMNTLALAALVILIAHPPSLFLISFQLSFITVFFIIFGLNRVDYLSAIQLSWDRLQIIKKVSTFIMVSFLAFLGSLPIVMVYFNQVSFVGILANLFIIPLIGFVAVPLGLTSVILYPVFLPAASWCIKASSFVIEKSITIVSFFSELPFAAIKTLTPTVLEILCFYLLIGSIIQLKKNRLMKYIAISVVLVLSVDTVYWLHQRFFHDDLKVTIIDVGQGSSALLEIPGGETMLIDGGGFSDNTYFDIGERVVGPLLWRKKIMTVDTLVLSHPNSDHLNGLIYIAKHFNVRNIWANGESADTFGYKKFMEIIQEEDITVPLFEKLSRDMAINNVVLEILYPEKDFLTKREEDFWRNKNNNSLVLKVTFGSTSILFPGDIEARGEIDLVSIAEDKLQSDILISSHHGSKSSSCNTFLDTIDPKYVIISSGWRNRFGFPHPTILKKYQKRGYKIFRTDQHGTITVTTDGENIEFETAVKGIKQ